MGVPAYNLGAIAVLKKKLIDDPTMWRFYNVPLVGDSFALFVLAVGKLLGGTVPADALTETCMDLLGQDLTRRRLERFALRVAANAGRIRKGHAVRPWTAQLEDEWAPVAVLRAWPGRSRKDEPGYHFRVRVLAGTPVGFRIVKFWTGPQYNYVARELGFDYRKGRPLQHPQQLVLLRFAAFFERRLSRDEPGFQQVHVTGSMLRHNEEVLSGRFRRGPGCPVRGFAHACHACWLGYADCPYAVHPKTYEQRICERCADPEAWHDPAEELDMCLACANKLRLKRKKD